MPAMKWTASVRSYRWVVVVTAAISLSLFPFETSIMSTSVSSMGDWWTSYAINKAGSDELVRFSPYPHREIGSGADLQCEWKTLETITGEETQSLLGSMEPTDLVQERALAEGICVPTQAWVKQKLHIFSSNEARHCLNNRTVIMTGDSHNQELYIGLGDILLGKPSSTQALSLVFRSTAEFIEMERSEKPMFPRVLWACTEQCGQLSRGCSNCIRRLQRQDRIDEAVVVVGTGAQLFETKSESKGKTMSQLQRFVKNSGLKFIFSSMPSRDSSSNPTSYRRRNSGAQSIYWKSLDLMRQHSVPFVDTFQMTHSCYQEGCKVDDEAHGSRFVNRWKAQLLLNVLCDFRGSALSDQSSPSPQHGVESHLGRTDGAEQVSDVESDGDLNEGTVQVAGEPTEPAMMSRLGSETDQSSSYTTNKEDQGIYVSAKDVRASQGKESFEVTVSPRANAADVEEQVGQMKSKTTTDAQVQGLLNRDEKLSSAKKARPTVNREEPRTKALVRRDPRQPSRPGKKPRSRDVPSSDEGETRVESEKRSPRLRKSKRTPEDQAINVDASQKAKRTMAQENNTVKRTIRFIPYPHRNLGSGASSRCTWIARNADDANDDVVSQLLGDDAHSPDKMQRMLLEETICVPDSERRLAQLHLFSAVEARQCLSNITLAVTGDSYNRQLFIGLGEILLSKASNEHITSGSQRTVVLERTQEALRAERKRSNGQFPDVHWICLLECYGKRTPFSSRCSRCVEEFRLQNTKQVVVPVVGSARHIFANQDRYVQGTLTELTTFFQKTPKIIYTSQPDYKMSAVPAKYRNCTRGIEGVYWRLLPQLNQYDLRFLDYFQVTHSCFFDNCTSDGGHRSRFVNRWKAQLLLNTLCDYTA